jgi:hypothetical protein
MQLRYLEEVQINCKLQLTSRPTPDVNRPLVVAGRSFTPPPVDSSTRPADDTIVRPGLLPTAIGTPLDVKPVTRQDSALLLLPPTNFPALLWKTMASTAAASRRTRAHRTPMATPAYVSWFWSDAVVNKQTGKDDIFLHEIFLQ